MVWCSDHTHAQSWTPPAPIPDMAGSYRTKLSCPPLDYQSLLNKFSCACVKTRLIQPDLTFARSALEGRLDCVDIVGMFPLSVPGRRTRRPELFHVPRGSGRVDSVRRGFLIRVPQHINSFMQSSPHTDLFWSSRSLRSDIAQSTEGQGTFLQ